MVSSWFSTQIKNHFLTLGFYYPFQDYSFNNTIIEKDTEEKIHGIVIDNKLNFKSRLKHIYKKDSQKLRN